MITSVKELENVARNIRANIVECIASLGVGHIGGCLSIADVLAVLYGKHMRYDPKEPKKEGRDRLVCSKGHAGPAVYSALAEFGFFPKEELYALNRGGTKLPSHCDMNKTPGVDMTAGSLGQGLSCALGAAIGSKLKGDGATIYAIIGDGESQEGQIWEALMYAGNMKLDNLTVFIDYNRMQIDGYTDEINSLDPLDDKYRAFNLNTLRINGHDIAAIDEAINAAKACKDKCTAVIMDTIKGYGVPWAESRKVGSHSFAISEEQWREFCGKEAD